MILTTRDVNALKILSSHKFMTSKQFAAIAYSGPKYETSRKRIEDLLNHKFIDFCYGESSHHRGRPANILFLSSNGKNILSSYLESDYPINYGKGTKYSRKLYCEISSIVAGLIEINNKRIITDIRFKSANEFLFERGCKSNILKNILIDGILMFNYRNKAQVQLAIKQDNGKLRLKSFFNEYRQFITNFELISCVLSPDWKLSDRLTKSLSDDYIENNILFSTKIEFETKPLHQIIFKNKQAELLKLKYLFT